MFSGFEPNEYESEKNINMDKNGKLAESENKLPRVRPNLVSELYEVYQSIFKTSDQRMLWFTFICSVCLC